MRIDGDVKTGAACRKRSEGKAGK